MTAGWVRGVRLGIDVGSVRVGVAVCDPDGILATPVATVPRDPAFVLPPVPDPARAGRSTPDPARTQPATPDPARTQPATPEPARTQPSTPESAGDEPPRRPDLSTTDGGPKKRAKPRHKRAQSTTHSDDLQAVSDSASVITPSDISDQVADRPKPPIPTDIAEIVRLAHEYETVEVVVGLPLDLAGNEGLAAKKVREYARILGEALGPVPIVMADERMSTVTAARRLSDRGVKGKRQRSVVDQAAAVEILQQYLESRRRQR